MHDVTWCNSTLLIDLYMFYNISPACIFLFYLHCLQLSWLFLLRENFAKGRSDYSLGINFLYINELPILISLVCYFYAPRIE